MPDWLNQVAGPDYARAVLWTGLALLALLVLLIAVKLVRSMTFGTFVAGGRNRKARLAVMDAAAIDSQRRLVLIRRDDVEHLLLIGGPTDVVVERDIRFGVPQRRMAPTAETAPPSMPEMVVPVPQPVPAPAPRPRPQEPAQRAPAASQQAPAPRSQPERPASQAAPRPAEPPRPAVSVAAPNIAPPQEPSRTMPSPATIAPRIEARNPSAPPRRPEPAPPVMTSSQSGPPAADHLDDDLLKELEVSLDDGDIAPKAAPAKSLDDEMTKLLGELANPRR